MLLLSFGWLCLWNLYRSRELAGSGEFGTGRVVKRCLIVVNNKQVYLFVVCVLSRLSIYVFFVYHCVHDYISVVVCVLYPMSLCYFVGRRGFEHARGGGP